MGKSPLKKDNALLEKLQTVIDPELNISITEMGLIYGIMQAHDTVYVMMTLTTIGCPLYDVIHAEIVRTLQSSDPSIKNVAIELTFDPPWNPDMMSDSAKMEIGFL